MSSEQDIVMKENDDTQKKSTHSKDKKSSKEKEKPTNSSKKTHKKSRKSSDKSNKASKKSSKSSKHDKNKHPDKSSKNKSKKKDSTSKSNSKNKSKQKEKRKKKRSLSPSSHSHSYSRSPSHSHSHSRSRDHKRRRSRSRSRSHSKHRYSRSNYNRSYSRSRSPSPYRSHKRHRRRKRYKRSRRHHSRSRTRSRSPSSSHSTTKNKSKTENTDVNNPNGSKVAEIKATAPNAMQQLNSGQRIADPLAAFNSVFGNLTRPAVLALTNPIQQPNATLQQLLSGTNPYKLNCGLSGTANSINPILMNQMAAELRKSAVEQQTKIAAAKLADINNSTDNKSTDDSLFFKVHLPGMNTLTAIGGIHPQITRPARRLYVGNLPVGMGLTEQILTEFFSQCCKGLGIGTINPVLSVWLNSEQTFGFIEFRSVQDTNLALQLFEGLQLGGRQLRFGRPVDYKEPPDNLKNYVVGEHGSGGGNVVSNGTNIEQGSPAAMLVLQQQQQKDALKNALNSQQQEMAKKTLNVAISTKQKAMLDAMIDGDVEMKENININMETNVLLLLNMLTEDDIKDDEEYADILDDIQCECENYGHLLEVVVPRIGEKGCGRVFLKYENLLEAKKCKSKVDGRKFGTNMVKCVYFKEELFNGKKYDHNID